MLDERYLKIYTIFLKVSFKKKVFRLFA